MNAKITAAEALRQRCPKCTAEAGVHCWSQSSPWAETLTRPHRERVAAARSAKEAASTAES